jgi:PAS domain S-box-containing protein
MFPRTLEDKLIGPRYSFSMESRVYHALSIMVIIMLSLFFVLNMYIDVFGSRLIIALTFITQCTLYYLSRVQRMFTIAVIVNALISYVAIIVTYYISSGVDGPNIFLFFMTFALLIAITEKKLHKLWLVLHIVTVLAIINHQYFLPGAIPFVYKTRFDRYLDIQVTYLIVLALIYVVMLYLKRYYMEEKYRAEEMAATVEQQNKVLENSETTLRAFFNSSLSCHLLLGHNGEILAYNHVAQKYMAERYGIELEAGYRLNSTMTSSYQQRFMDNYRSALAGKRISEEALVRNEGYEVWWSFTFEPAYTHTGAIMGVSITSTNIHERKMQEEKLKEHYKALSDIAFIQSHEIRRPVASIIGLMDIIKNEGYTPSKEYLQMLEEATKELDEKIHKIMDQANDLL